jgi:dethiobiotin synthetase
VKKVFLMMSQNYADKVGDMTMRGLFITGTDTGVGKTHVSCAIVRDLRSAGHRVGAYKPVCSGVRFDANGRPVWDDVEELRRALGGEFSDDQISPQRFAAPLAPPIAARQEGRSVDLAELQRGFDDWRSRCDLLIVEAAGGLLCPLSENETMADLAARFQLPLLIVARCGLGTINHTLLTIEVARARGLRVVGVLMNEATPLRDDDISLNTNATEIALRGDVSVLGIRHYQSAGWVSRFGEPVQLDWLALAEVGVGG